MTIGTMKEFKTSDKLLEDIMVIVPDYIVCRNTFTHALTIFNVYIYEKGLKKTVHIGDDWKGYNILSKFIKNNSFSHYSFVKNAEVINGSV